VATSPPTRADRDANLDALQAAVDEWAESEITRLDNETQFLRAVLQGRTGSKELAQKNLASAGALLQAEIDAFIASS
jgi:hypothetical protein